MKTIEIDECIRRIRSYAMQFEAEGKRNISEDLWVAVDFLKRKTEMCFDCTQREWYMRGYQDGLNADKWIPCEERLPEEHDGYYSELIRRGFKGASYDQCSDVVLVTIISRYGDTTITKAQTFDGKWNYEWETKEVGYNKVKEVRTGAKVLAWKPLPTPYKKEGAE